MLSIRGIYTGLEQDKINQKAESDGTNSSQNLTQLFLDKCGGWKDTRCSADLVSEIYASRTSSEKGKQLFEGVLLGKRTT